MEAHEVLQMFLRQVLKNKRNSNQDLINLKMISYIVSNILWKIIKYYQQTEKLK